MRSRLITAAHELRREIYASLPWGFRVAELLVKLAGHTDDFGRVAYGLFLMAGVTGMPTINGHPPEVFEPESVQDIPHRIPRGYGREFGAKVYRTLLKNFGGYVDIVEDIMSAGMLKVLNKENEFFSDLRGLPLARAEQILIVRLIRLGKDMVRKFDTQHGRLKSKPVDDEGRDVIETIEDPNSWADLGEMIPERVIDNIQKDLAAKINPKVLPDLPLYFKLLMEGYTDAEILRDRMLPFLQGSDKVMTQGNWVTTYKNKIKDVMERHLPELTGKGELDS